MANLSGQNIGTNYKGILNLNTLNGNLSGTLQAVTDGDGNASPLTLSTGEVGISRTIALGAGSSNVRLINETYTINNSGAQTGTATGIFLNATETALNGMGHNLMDLQVGGVSQFRISKTDSTIYATNYNISASVYLGQAIAVSNSGGVKVGDSRVRSDGDGNLTLLNDAANSFGLLKLGGTTNAFPAIKRNGAAIDFRLADDSGFCNITASNVNANLNMSVSAGGAYIISSRGFIGAAADGVWNLYDSTTANFAKLHFGPTTKPAVCQGAGTPEGAVTAPVGSIFMRSDGGAGTSFYVKESGTGNTGWVAK
jgi:hypothetical protein